MGKKPQPYLRVHWQLITPREKNSVFSTGMLTRFQGIDPYSRTFEEHRIDLIGLKKMSTKKKRDVQSEDMMSHGRVKE